MLPFLKKKNEKNENQIKRPGHQESGSWQFCCPFCSKLFLYFILPDEEGVEQAGCNEKIALENNI